MEDKDANCRLRHGLNVHCLAHIFHYIDSADLYTVGEMNEFYKQIINDLVISRHEVNFSQLYIRRITIQQVFERYGKKIRKFYFDDIYNHKFTILAQLINQYCSINQLISVNISCGFRRNGVIELPIQCQNVKRLDFCAGQLNIQLSERLRFLTLTRTDVNANFDWTKLKNLMELQLMHVNDINVENFIEFLRQCSSLEVFQHDQYTFEASSQEVCDAMSKYCGLKIRKYSGEMPPNQDGHETRSSHNLYEFISGLKNAKEVCLTTHQLCAGDLIDGIKRLAENNTIETLCIQYSQDDRLHRQNVVCIFQNGQNPVGSDMRHFSHLKTITLSGFQPGVGDNIFHHGKVCDPFKILKLYSPQMLANVETLTIEYAARDWDFIKFAPKLRYLELFGRLIASYQATEILLALANILEKRKNEQIVDDSIDVMFDRDLNFNAFQNSQNINGRNECIKISIIERFKR